MKEIWLTIDQVAQLTGWSTRHVRRVSPKFATRTSAKADRNGKYEREYALSSLPQKAQLAYTHLQVRDVEQQHSLALAPRPGTLFAAPIDVDSRELTTLSPAQRDQALQRLDAITPLLHWCDGDRPSVALTLADSRVVSNSNLLAEYLAAQHNVSPATIWNWKKAFTTHGLKGLARKVRSDKETSRFFTDYPLAAKFVLAKYKELCHGEADSIATITAALRREWPNLYNHGSQPPSYATVRAYVNLLPPVVRDSVRLTGQQHGSKYSPYLQTDFTKLRPNQIWVSDHRIHDFFVQNDVFGDKDLAAVRIWETAIIDMRTRVIVGSVFNLTPSSHTISSALRMAIAAFGLPEMFYVDNGKDYRKIGKGADRGFTLPADWDKDGRPRIAPEAQGLLARLGITVKYCLPMHPQSKLIESYFNGQAKRFDMLMGPAYSGPRPDRRPDACEIARRAHRDFLEGRSQSTPLPLASDVIELSLASTREYNELHEHRGRGMDGRAPLQVMNELLPPAQRRLVDVTQIEELFWDRTNRVVLNAMVTLDKFTYEGADEESAKNLYLANGTSIFVARDPNNMGEALAFDENHRFIGRLLCQALVERGPTSHEAIRQSMRLRRKLTRAAKDFWKVARGVPSEIDYLRGRHNLEAGEQPPAPKPRLLPTSQATAPALRPAYIDDVVDELLEDLT